MNTVINVRSLALAGALLYESPAALLVGPAHAAWAKTQSGFDPTQTGAAWLSMSG